MSLETEIELNLTLAKKKAEMVLLGIEERKLYGAETFAAECSAALIAAQRAQDALDQQREVRR